MKLKTRVRNWGSSLGIILPKELVRQEKLRPREEVIIEIIKRPEIEKLFGLVSFRQSAQEIKNEMKKGWE